MERQIFEILDRTIYYMDHDRKRTAKEITSHIMEFIEWIRNSNSLNKKLADWVYDKITTGELYEYWLTNVKQ